MTPEDEREVLDLLRQRTQLQREVRPLLDRIEEISARLQAKFAADQSAEIDAGVKGR